MTGFSESLFQNRARLAHSQLVLEQALSITIMELELSVFLIVCPLVFLAGLIDSIAGGGGLIA
ncbi:MAG: hypothetical protein LBB78_00890, partial [Spirochaetaceae bacterium]|nr:hypothetical protein [Spirochaetaceae bacterium]